MLISRGRGSVSSRPRRTRGSETLSKPSKSKALTPREAFVEKWEHYTFWPLISLGALFLALYAYPIIWPNLSTETIFDIDVAMDIIWALFVLDFLVKLLVTEHKRDFLSRHIIDMVALILPFARPLQAVRAIGVATLALRKFGAKVRHRVLIYVGTLAVFVWFVAGLAVTQAERGVSGANIKTISDGWWWSFMTMATVGFGDRYPVTDEGRTIGVVLVIGGLVLLGTLTAAIATWFINTSRREEDEILEASDRKMLREIASLRRELKELREALGGALTPGETGGRQTGAPVRRSSQQRASRSGDPDSRKPSTSPKSTT
jgi:voltage-gated potassium channel